MTRQSTVSNLLNYISKKFTFLKPDAIVKDILRSPFVWATEMLRRTVDTNMENDTVFMKKSEAWQGHEKIKYKYVILYY